ncbi:UDP-N-acetylmuramate dehydrogenase [Ferrimonas sediminum]|uniref:UDP-N-acetylenolpyruvoylglucosamine reductase n=1 Tax=Ferrimonas sediminum TaxID=718193 RepID=A0A1G9BVP8_9GAMM|nr:UDP-N-acetylmuramate dehydrogenase [Ferrimonas sediminum]SDK43516.1 UDP-N-acetylmuramate dehydrogenase [Ferrimonas sediminum]
MALDIRTNCSLIPYHSFGLQSTAKALVEIHTPEELREVYFAPDYRDVPKLVLGSGSNTVFLQPFDGLIIINRILGRHQQPTEDGVLVHLGAGEDWHTAVMWSLAEGIHGLENLALIPGTAGAAPVQNIGAYGVEFASVCAYVDVLEIDSGETRRLNASDCQFGYRDSIFKGELKDKVVIVGVGLRLSRDWKPQLAYGPLKTLQSQQALSAAAVAEHIMLVRRQKLPDPKLLGNAGSFFKNPVVSQAVYLDLKQRYPEMPAFASGANGNMKLAAGWLIDQAGLKGYRHQGVGVHEQQALVLVNYGNGTADELISLATKVATEVQSRFGVTLIPEVRLLDRTGNQHWGSHAE